eukprot:gene661-biopygen12161
MFWRDWLNGRGKWRIAGLHAPPQQSCKKLSRSRSATTSSCMTAISPTSTSATAATTRRRMRRTPSRGCAASERCRKSNRRMLPCKCRGAVLFASATRGGARRGSGALRLGRWHGNLCILLRVCLTERGLRRLVVALLGVLRALLVHLRHLGGLLRTRQSCTILKPSPPSLLPSSSSPARCSAAAATAPLPAASGSAVPPPPPRLPRHRHGNLPGSPPRVTSQGHLPGSPPRAAPPRDTSQGHLPGAHLPGAPPRGTSQGRTSQGHLPGAPPRGTSQGRTSQGRTSQGRTSQGHLPGAHLPGPHLPGAPPRGAPPRAAPPRAAPPRAAPPRAAPPRAAPPRAAPPRAAPPRAAPPRAAPPRAAPPRAAPPRGTGSPGLPGAWLHSRVRMAARARSGAFVPLLWKAQMEGETAADASRTRPGRVLSRFSQQIPASAEKEKSCTTPGPPYERGRANGFPGVLGCPAPPRPGSTAPEGGGVRCGGRSVCDAVPPPPPSLGGLHVWFTGGLSCFLGSRIQLFPSTPGPPPLTHPLRKQPPKNVVLRARLYLYPLVTRTCSPPCSRRRGARRRRSTGTVARAWRGHGAGVARAIGMFWLGVARAWRGHGAGVARAFPVPPGIKK